MTIIVLWLVSPAISRDFGYRDNINSYGVCNWPTRLEAAVLESGGAVRQVVAGSSDVAKQTRSEQRTGSNPGVGSRTSASFERDQFDST